jgi:RNA polymerase sigma-70 factor (ECF subfamily)
VGQRAFIASSVRKLGVPPDAVEDAVQDVFVVAHRRLLDLTDRAAARTWLFAIALRVARDHRRSHRRRIRLRSRAEELVAARATGRTACVEHRHALRQMLAALTREHATLLILADVAGMTAPELSALLDTQLSTVYTRLRAARSALRHHWQAR